MSAKPLEVLGVPADFAESTIDDFDGKRDWKAKKLVAEIVTKIRERVDSRLSLNFVGKPRVGKTMLASIILRAAHEQAYTCRFVPFRLYTRHLLRRMDLQRIIEHHQDDEAFDRWQSLNYQIDRIFGCEVLVLDDIGKGQITPFVSQEFEYLVRRRYDRGRSTILTTNLLSDDVITRFGGEVEAFLSQAFQTIGVLGEGARRDLSQ